MDVRGPLRIETVPGALDHDLGRYMEPAEPETSAGTWVVENLVSIERLLGALRARLNRMDEERRRVDEELSGETDRLAELPGAEAN